MSIVQEDPISREERLKREALWAGRDAEVEDLVIQGSFELEASCSCGYADSEIVDPEDEAKVTRAKDVLSRMHARHVERLQLECVSTPNFIIRSARESDDLPFS
jgi:hypothetical protein